jgi:hypothetical protein
VLIGGGLVILLAIALVLVAYFLFSGRRQPTIQVNLPPAAPPPPPPMVTSDFGDEPFAGRTFDPVETVDQKARLVVVEGHQALANSSYNLDKPDLKLGRNTPKEANNDIPVQDKEVSRSHARIFYRERQFFIQDQGSSTGTMVNAKKINPFQEVLLQNRDEIGLGPRIKLRFELVSPPARTHPDQRSQGDLATTDSNDDADRTIFNL